MSLRETSEAELIQRVNHDDGEALDELQRRHRNRVYGFVRVRVPNDADAQDVTQETWITLWRKRGIVDPARPFIAWALYWAHFELLQYYEARGRRREVELLIGEMRNRFPDAEEDREVSALLDRLTARAHPSGPRLGIPSDAEVYDALLRITFASSSPPHQLIVFGFCKILGWKPRQVADELSGTPLFNLEEKLENDYLEASGLREPRMRSYFADLRARLNQTFGEVVSEPRTLRTHPGLVKRVVGKTKLEDYYRESEDQTTPEAQRKARSAKIVHWWNAVQKRVVRQILREEPEPLLSMLLRKEKQKPATKCPTARMEKRRQSK